MYRLPGQGLLGCLFLDKGVTDPGHREAAAIYTFNFSGASADQVRLR
jgi:hypothetical protein